MPTRKIAFSAPNLNTIAESITTNKVLILPSDTLYGISCTALNEPAVERIYALKQRDYNKPFIILIPDVPAIAQFNIQLSSEVKKMLNTLWPAKLTIVIKCPSADFKYLHRGNYSLGFRIPDNTLLRELLLRTGPIVSTTVNVSGEEPAESIPQAQKLFATNIDLYVENGVMRALPTTVIALENEGFTLLRQGDYKLPQMS